MKTLGVGIIGCGNISSIYMQNLPRYEGLALRACADVKAEAASAQAAKYGIEPESVDGLLKRDDIDIVVNLTFPNAHFDVSHAALSAGKHVFSEKPLTVSVEQGRRLVAEAKARGVLLGCAPDTFIGAGGRLARRLVDEGKVGRIIGGTAMLMSHGMEHWHPDPEFFFKPGGGPILDMAPYYLSALVNLMGPVKRVQALAGQGFDERIISAASSPRKGEAIKVETATTVMTLLEFASGAMVTMIMSWDVWKHGLPPIELYGAEGSLRVPDPNFFGGEVEITERGNDWQKVDSAAMPFGKPNWRSPNWPPEAPDRANYRGLGVAELANAARTGGAHRASGAFAQHVLEVMYAILEAGDGGGAVTVASGLEDRPAVLTDDLAASFWRG